MGIPQSTRGRALKARCRRMWLAGMNHGIELFEFSVVRPIEESSEPTGAGQDARKDWVAGAEESSFVLPSLCFEGRFAAVLSGGGLRLASAFCRTLPGFAELSALSPLPGTPS